MRGVRSYGVLGGVRNEPWRCSSLVGMAPVALSRNAALRSPSRRWPHEQAMVNSCTCAPFTLLSLTPIVFALQDCRNNAAPQLTVPLARAQAMFPGAPPTHPLSSALPWVAPT
ncbi:uncharacterized protein CC84DRAFT_210951 [Paraphaeosphaeria sporulosa]|uniref:Uncharacterized protein n=1 Tax=Paraphaeosphaeria sporulosa TaxID=1460663 RepID=A0A177C2K6_9PLEO|nr:uncharacterized protein CC84DRAFT_210951 [Paraphaeosphaeria sporulosa]OAG01675.1 hypothetical protein CC84DRAFT_210951 [Paraphaeosphaeria sporulosa]